MGRAGRSGGGGGGGGRSGGGGSAGRSFGGGSPSAGRAGRSGGPSGGGGSYRGGGYNNGYRRPIRTGPIFVGGFGPRFRGHGRRGGGGCLGVFITVFSLIIIMSIIGTIFSGSQGNQTGYNNVSIPASTVERTKLASGAVNETAYYTDELGWIRSSSTLNKGMKHFYDETGIQPHLYITDNVEGDHNPDNAKVQAFMENLYDELFTDEAHYLVLFQEYNDQYKRWYMGGTQTKTVMDNEASDILMAYIDSYYYSDYDEDEFFAKAFSDAADRIMHVEKSVWPWVWLVIGIAVIAFIVYMILKNRAAHKKSEAEATERILKTPLETFGDKKAEDLADKYKDK